MAGLHGLAAAVSLLSLIASGLVAPALGAAQAVERTGGVAVTPMPARPFEAAAAGGSRLARSATPPSNMTAQIVGGDEARRLRPGFSPYRAGAYAGAAEAGAIIGADAVDGALDSPPPPDPACNFPSQPIGSLSAGIPPCNYCENPPCN